MIWFGQVVLVSICVISLFGNRVIGVIICDSCLVVGGVQGGVVGVVGVVVVVGGMVFCFWQVERVSIVLSSEVEMMMVEDLFFVVMMKFLICDGVWKMCCDSLVNDMW